MPQRWSCAGLLKSCRLSSRGIQQACRQARMRCTQQPTQPPGRPTLRLLVWYRSALPASRVANSDLRPPSPLTR